MQFFQVIVQQGSQAQPKREKKFLQFLEDLHKSLQGELFSFEMLGSNQYTSFFYGCQERSSKLIEGLLYASFPGCEIHPSTDPLQGSASTFLSTQLRLNKSDIYPLKTFSDFEADSLSTFFSVISKLNRNDQVWVQFLIRARKESWNYHLGRRVKMQINRVIRNFRVKDIVRLKKKSQFFKEEDAAFIEKTEQHPFDVEIRIACQADENAVAEKNLLATARAFFPFNKTDFNEFKLQKLRKNEQARADYKRRKASSMQSLSSKELATLYHFPNTDHVPHVLHLLAKKHEAPRNLPTRPNAQAAQEKHNQTSFFGRTNHHNNHQDFGIKRSDRRRHLYTVGKSGTGKSKLLESLIQSDILAGKGVAVLDPHGDLVDNILKTIPEHRIKDVIYFDPGDVDFPIAFNPLEIIDEKYKMQVTKGFIDIFKKLFGDNWSDRLEHVLRYTTLALLDSPNTTVVSIMKMLSDKHYRQKIISQIQDNVVKNFWVNEFAGWSEKFDAEAITPLLNKVGQLVSTNMIRNIVGQPKNTFDIRDIMDNQKILLMKVSKGLLGEENAQLIGSMIITKIYQAAMARADMPEEERKDFYFYVDEFQNFATDTFAEILSEARKYRLCLTIAHQYLGQLTPEVRKTVFGNVGSMISFRVGAEDATILAEEYTPIFDVRDIINLGVREFYTKLSIDGELSEAFSGRTLDMNYPEQDHSKAIIEASRAAYCSSKLEVEKQLSSWDEAAQQESTNGQLNGSSHSQSSNGIQQASAFEMPLI
jgi:hypothetical protein